MDNNNMKKQFNNFVEVERMLQFLDIQEVTTKRQKKNGTREFKLPIKDLYCSKGSYIHVASFASGYVRRTKASGYCPSWQLNKREMSEPSYYPEHKWVDGEQVKTGKYLKFTTRGCKLIPDEQDRIAYLISFCLKNYYINHANKVARASDEYIPKWKHEDELQYARKLEDKVCNPEVKVIVNGHRYNVI
jgi:hypothetical protein